MSFPSLKDQQPPLTSGVGNVDPGGLDPGLAPTLKNPGKEIPNCILKTLISFFRCV